MGYFILILLTIKQIQVIHGPNQKDEKKKTRTGFKFLYETTKICNKSTKKKEKKKKGIRDTVYLFPIRFTLELSTRISTAASKLQIYTEEHIHSS